MDDGVCRAECEKLARRLGIEVRYTAGGPSGLCRVKGRRVLFMDRTLDDGGKIEVFIREFKALDLEGVFLVPLIRRLLGMEYDDRTGG